MKCLVCQSPLGEPVYTSTTPLAVSSLARLLPGQARVRFCQECAHLQTDPLENTQAYYDEGYNILTDAEDEDHLYALKDGKKVFRADHQFHTLAAKVDLPHGCRVLDYGCGKSPVLKRLAQSRHDVVPHLFDISDAYIPFWEKFATSSQWACYEPKVEWAQYFDVILSFFALEHTTDPRSFVADVARMLKPDGVFYFLIPNLYGANSSDLFVIDHVSHFSPCSLSRLLGEYGMEIAALDARVHDLAYVVVARKTGRSVPTSSQEEVNRVARRVNDIARFWSTAQERIRDFEHHHPGPASIYGAGACGCFIATCLDTLDPLTCFIDQNPHKQGKTLAGKPIFSLEDFGDRHDAIYVGLNPDRARPIMNSLHLSWSQRNPRFFL